MVHVAIIRNVDKWGGPGTGIAGVVKFDGKTLMLVGDDDFIEDWSPYFSSNENEWFTEHRLSQNPFGFVQDPTWEIMAEENADERFLEAFTRLDGKRVKTFDYPRAS